MYAPFAEDIVSRHDRWMEFVRVASLRTLRTRFRDSEGRKYRWWKLDRRIHERLSELWSADWCRTLEYRWISIYTHC